MNHTTNQPTLKDLRTFSLIWSFIFLIIAVYPLASGGGVRIWAVGFVVFFLIIAYVRPIILAWFYRSWVKFGVIIGGAISKIILVALFYGVFFPFGLALRLLGKDPLKRKLDSEVTSYWNLRETQPGSMKNQF
jgi:hypothetical protein